MRNARPNGTIRRSQVLTTYGPGAMVDLPNRAVLIGGLLDRHRFNRVDSLFHDDTSVNLRFGS